MIHKNVMQHWNSTIQVTQLYHHSYICGSGKIILKQILFNQLTMATWYVILEPICHTVVFNFLFLFLKNKWRKGNCKYITSIPLQRHDHNLQWTFMTTMNYSRHASRFLSFTLTWICSKCSVPIPGSYGHIHVTTPVNFFKGTVDVGIWSCVKR